MESDEPWQTLACCMEVAQAVRSPDPAAYVSHLPVHQVGTHGAEPGALGAGIALGSCVNWDHPVGLVS